MNDQPVLDFFSYRKNEDGTYTILKNGDSFLPCTGTEQDAKNIVETLERDRKR